MQTISEKISNTFENLTALVGDSFIGEFGYLLDDAVKVITPFLLIAGILSLITNLPFEFWQNLISPVSKEIRTIIILVFEVIGILFGVILTSLYAEKKDISKNQALILSVFSILILCASFELESQDRKTFLDGSHAILFSMLIVPLCIKSIELERKYADKLNGMGVAGKGLRYLIWFFVPALVLILQLNPYVDLSVRITNLFMVLINLLNWLPFFLLITFIYILSYYAGTAVFGTVLHGWMAPLLFFCLSANAMSAAAGDAVIPFINAEGFIQYGCLLGGPGGLIGMRILMKTMRKFKSSVLLEQKQVLKDAGKKPFSEFYLYGIPVCQNPFYLITFAIVPVVLEGITFVLIQNGMISPIIGLAKWDLLPGLSGFLISGGDWRNVVWQLAEVLILVIAYWIPTKIYDLKMAKSENAI